jgi:ribonucleotide monophosphatase NagD (HAD superfamily)
MRTLHVNLQGYSFLTNGPNVKVRTQEEHIPQVMVNSLPISATTNLSLALKYLKREKGLHWIDALCIGQEDDKERSHQVQMMARIYQSAEGVYAWLGLSDEESSLGIQLLADFMVDFRMDLALG